MANYETEIFKDKKGEFRWRRTSPNGEVVAVSAEGFNDRVKCSSDEASAFVIGWRASESINRVEGLALTSEMKSEFGMFARNAIDPAERRAALRKRYGDNSVK